MPLTKEELLERIARAMDSITIARAELNVETHVCDECGLTHYANRNHWQAAQALRAACTKLDRALSLLHNDTTANDD